MAELKNKEWNYNPKVPIKNNLLFHPTLFILYFIL